MNKPIRTVSVFCLLLFVALMINATYLQFFQARALDDDPLNRRVLNAAYSSQRGPILVDHKPIVESVPSDDQYKYQRRYDQPFVYAPVTGYFTFGNFTGIESSQNTVLSGDDPRLFVPNLVDLFSQGNQAGGSVELTLNPKAQRAAYNGLSALGSDVQGAVVAIEPKTGRILAMVSLPTYNPNKLASHDFDAVDQLSQELNKDPAQPLLNRAIQTRLPPGSVFKPVTAAAAVASGRYPTADSKVPGGPTYQLPESTSVVTNEAGLSCGTGDITFRQAMENSCNTTFAPLAVEVGAQGMLEQAEAFGFNSTALTDLGPEAPSVYPPDADKPQTGLSGFGQFDVAATPLQMAMVAAGIANHGVVMKPYLVDEVQSQDFDAHKTEPQKLSEATTPQVADVVSQLMVSTVDSGTARTAAIDGVPVAGKTGTAQTGRNSSPYAWFISFAPASDDPQVAVAVMIQKSDTSRESVSGGGLGGPIAKSVMEAVIGQ